MHESLVARMRERSGDAPRDFALGKDLSRYDARHARLGRDPRGCAVLILPRRHAPRPRRRGAGRPRGTARSSSARSRDSGDDPADDEVARARRARRSLIDAGEVCPVCDTAGPVVLLDLEGMCDRCGCTWLIGRTAA
jgi:hypothetical protein